MVMMKPISVLNNKPARAVKRISFRPITENGLSMIKDYFSKVDWEKLMDEDSAHRKAEKFQNFLVSKYEEFFPEKVISISSDDQPFISTKLKRMKRRKSREYQKHRRSDKWNFLQKNYQAELEKSKREFYRKKIRDLRKMKPKNWHREIKKLSSFDQNTSEEIVVESIKELPADEQAEKIADNFASISQEYDELKTEDIIIPNYSSDEIPQFNEKEVKEALEKLDANKSDVKGDLPAKVLKACAEKLAMPIADLVNTCIRQGKWPDIFKIEVVTPVPKVYPPQTIDQLRNISGLLNLDKVAEKLISNLIISDMKKQIDHAQYANQPGVSIQHYLIKFIDRILGELDRGKKCAVLATLVDWKQAFPRQCPKLGVESFMKNGVRPALIPLLVNYFQGCQMKVKWKGLMSRLRRLKGGGPQGSTFGIWEYLSQSNDNAECIDDEDKFKFVDDLSFIEIILLLSVGMARYNIHAHVPSDVPTHSRIIPKENQKSQEYLKEISKWTDKKKMKLNEKKTKNLIFISQKIISLQQN